VGTLTLTECDPPFEKNLGCAPELSNLPGYFTKVSFEDNFHWSLSPMLVQPQYPCSKEHFSIIAAKNKRTGHYM